MSTNQNPKNWNIFLAVDGSQHARAATRLVKDLPLPPGSSITALGVVTPLQIPGQSVLSAALDEAQATLSAKPELRVLTGLLHGHPADELISYANQHHPDLIVMGAKGLRATLGILLGGIAQQVVEYAEWPVLVVRAPYTVLKRALLVTDGSLFSQCAAEFLASFPLPVDMKIEIAHVLPPLITAETIARSWPVGMGELPSLPIEELEETYQRQAEELEQKGKNLLGDMLHFLEITGVSASSILLRGDAATEIIEYANKNQVDLILCGSRGLSQVQSWLLGSVSRKLIHYASCSILVVKGKSKTHQ
jgi:nucleotide-binding universal stress UspA family protein